MGVGVEELEGVGEEKEEEEGEDKKAAGEAGFTPNLVGGGLPPSLPLREVGRSWRVSISHTYYSEIRLGLCGRKQNWFLEQNPKGISLRVQEKTPHTQQHTAQTTNEQQKLQKRLLVFFSFWTLF